MRERWMIAVLVSGSLLATTAAATGTVTVFDQLQQIDATAEAQRSQATALREKLDSFDAQLDERWTSVDIAMRAARPIRNDVTEGLARWLAVHRAADRESMGGPQAAADTRRLLRYAAVRALPARLRDVDVVRRADAERSGFADLLRRRAQQGVVLARADAWADAATGARDALVEQARAGGVEVDFDRVDDAFEAVLAGLEPSAEGGDFHRFKGTLARPLTQVPEYHFGARAPLMRPGGWTYRPDLGEPVHAVHDGTVAFVGVVQGWGLVVVVDHGAGYRSVYGNLESASVNRGDQVSRADVIAAAGESGSLDGVRTYFELRKDDEPIDPAPWFLRR